MSRSDLPSLPGPQHRDVSEVSEAIAEALTQRFPQSRYQPMQLFYYVMVFVSQHFPEWVYDYLYIEYLMK